MVSLKFEITTIIKVIQQVILTYFVFSDDRTEKNYKTIVTHDIFLH